MLEIRICQDWGPVRRHLSWSKLVDMRMSTGMGHLFGSEGAEVQQLWKTTWVMLIV